jgi:hypothetical protein
MFSFQALSRLKLRKKLKYVIGQYNGVVAEHNNLQVIKKYIINYLYLHLIVVLSFIVSRHLSTHLTTSLVLQLTFYLHVFDFVLRGFDNQ